MTAAGPYMAHLKDATEIASHRTKGVSPFTVTHDWTSIAFTGGIPWYATQASVMITPMLLYGLHDSARCGVSDSSLCGFRDLSLRGLQVLGPRYNQVRDPRFIPLRRPSSITAGRP